MNPTPFAAVSAMKLTLKAPTFLWAGALMGLMLCAPSDALAQSLSTQASYLTKKENGENFYEIKAAFETYREGKEIQKGAGYKPFRRWLHQMEPRVYPTGKMPHSTEPWNVPRLYSQPAANQVEGVWESLGPVSRPTAGPHAYAGGVGRINKVRVDPTNSSTYFACAPGGGIWKSTNAGGNWDLLFPDETDENPHHWLLPTLPLTPTTPTSCMPLQAMTTAATPSDWASSKPPTVVTTGPSPTTPWEKSGFTVGRMLISPNNSNIIVAAARFGMLVSTDAGANWSYGSGSSGTRFRDVEFHPTNPDIVYGSSTTGFFPLHRRRTNLD